MLPSECEGRHFESFGCEPVASASFRSCVLSNFKHECRYSSNRCAFSGP